MRIDRKRALILALIATNPACGESHSPCGADGRYVPDDSADYCVYALPLPIVIEGGFSCPAEMKFQLDLGAHRVCSDRLIDRASLPSGLCTSMPGVCSEEAPPPVPQMPSAEGEPEPSMSTGMSPMPGALEDEDVRTWSECDSSTLETGLSGDRCPMTGVFGCGTTDKCNATFAMCPSPGILQVSELDILECAEDAAAAPAQTSPPIWGGVADCEAALQNGHSYDSCQGPFVCAQRTEDPCCVEYALCLDRGVLPTHMLVRYRFCERACSRVQPGTDSAPVTGCEYFAGEGESNWSEELRRADLPCDGDFICWNDHDLTNGGSDALNPRLNVLRWCGAGVVRGQHSTVSNEFVPDR